MDVLLVEDEDSTRELLAEDLNELGLSVVAAADAEEALRATEMQGPPAVLVTDLDLGPGIDGLELAAEVTTRWPETLVIFMTGEEGNLQLISTKTTSPCFLKPFAPPRLAKAVNSALEGSAD